MKTLIVADDLSGAADCAVAFARGDALVLLAEPVDQTVCEVLAIDADTRAGSAAEAAKVVAGVFARHARPGMTLFKKFDSTLRGHVAMEIAAALAALRALNPIAIVTPAFPATGRTLRDGRLYLNGVALEQTELWRQKKMTGDSDLAAMLRRAGLKTALAASGKMAAMAGNDALVCDAQNEADLAAIALAGRDLCRTILWAGAGGLARALAPPGKPTALAPPPVEGAILYMVGSQSSVSREQALRFTADPSVALLRVTAAMLQAAPPPLTAHDLVLMLDGEHAVRPHALAQAFAAWAAPLAAAADALLLTGGETARAVLGALGAHGLRLSGEVAPGVTLARAEGGVAHGRPVITKAGAFGDPQTLRLCRDVLRGRMV